ncbi:MAG: hypothetical protein HZA00_07435 [Nitrospinae bacterium]|nr:hypothetical protein [Nitrospinota bacterium]
MGLTIIECAVCAWRATCNLKFKYEGSSSLSCPEFTRDVSIGKRDEIASPSARNDIPPAKKPESKK